MDKKYIKLFIKDLLEYKKYHLISGICIVLNTIFTIVLPVVLMKIIDVGIELNNFEKLVQYSLIYLGIIIFQVFVKVGDDYIYAILSQKIALKLKRKLFESHYKKNLEKDNTEALTIIQNDIGVVEQIGTKFMFSILMDFLVAISMFVLLASIEFELLIIILIFQILILVSQKLFNKKINSIAVNFRESMAKNLSVVNEFVLNIKEFKRMKAYKYFLQKYNPKEELLRKNTVNLQLQMSLNGMIIYFLGGVITVTVLFIGGYKVIYEGISLGVIITFNIYCQKLIVPFTRLSQYSGEYTKAIISLKKIYDYIISGEEERSLEIADESQNETINDVQLENLSCKYDDKFIFENLNINFEKNKINTITGSNGVGKTTILKYLYGEGNSVNGDVKLGEKIINNLNDMSSMVGQDSMLFNDTIYKNLILDNDNLKLEQVLDVVKAVGMEEDINKLTDHLNTYIGEGGVQLSGGQKQKLLLARSILKNTKILILDEITSFMDEESELRVLNLLGNLKSEKIIVMVAHKKRMIEGSDKVIKLERNDENEVNVTYKYNLVSS
ncbi:MAG: ABC transporter transmembrane domain-containing protein [Sarcina sp.]